MKKAVTNSRKTKILWGTQNAYYRINWHHILFICCLTVIICATIFVGAVPTRIFGHDIFFLLDNGWRIVNGQSTHVDFTSAWGPVTFLIVGLGLQLSDYSVDGVGYGSAVFGLIIGVWSYYLCRSRMVPILQILLSLYLASLVVAPFPLGASFEMSSHAMVYNRYGYALLALIMVDVFPIKGDQQQKGTELIKGMSSGVATGIIFFLKASYFGSALILIAPSLLFKGFSRSHLSGLIFGFSVAAMVLLSFIQFDIISLLNDLKMAAGARVNSVFFDALLNKITGNIYIYLLVILMSVQVHFIETSKTERPDYSVLCFGIVVLFVDTLMLFSNQQLLNLPLSVVFSLLLVNRILIRYQGAETARAGLTSVFQRSLVFTGGVFFLFFFALEIAGLGYGVFQKIQVSKLQPVVKFIEPRLFPLVLFDHEIEPRSNGSEYIEYINDGVRLLRNNSESHETILTIDMFNPFPYAMGRKPAKGGVAAAAFNYTLNDKHHPSYQKYFGSADLVMVPKQPASHNIFYDGFYKIYKPALMHYFRLMAESDFWLLYRRK